MTAQSASSAGHPPAGAAGPRRRRPRDIGTVAESAVVKFLQGNGFPHAERRALRGAYDCGDITGTPGVCWEVKGGKAARTASDGQVSEWLKETEQERVNARADIGVLVLQRSGIGVGNAGRWWALVPWSTVYHCLVGPSPITPAAELGPMRWHLVDAVHFLRATGHGDAIDEVGA